jgi:riboflavin synthase
MFTGLIEQVGIVTGVSDASGTRRITVESPAIARQLRLGDSVSVSGVCLTALDITNTSFAADLAAETSARTSLKEITPGTPVNLELAMRADSGQRFGGHVVQGHVDGVASLVRCERIPDREDYRLDIAVPRDLSRYIVEKGSITVEGISLTVAQIEGDQVRIAIIPHTWSATNLHRKAPGDPLNIEVDVLAKYAEKQMESRTGALTIERLVEEGF